MIIGIGNKARQGKDETAAILKEKYGFRVYHFADPLKEECERFFGWSPNSKNVSAREAAPGIASKLGFSEDGDGYYFTGDGKTNFFPYLDHSLLQWFGSLRRSYNENYWVDAVMNNIMRDGRLHDNVVIADLRHKNEAQWINTCGGLTFQIRRILGNGEQYLAPDRDPNHISEVDMDDYNYSHIYDVPDVTWYSNTPVKFVLQEVAADIVAKIGEEINARLVWTSMR